MTQIYIQKHTHKEYYYKLTVNILFKIIYKNVSQI